jgi:hypothetical protein
LETAGWPTRSCRAAPEKDPVSTTLMKVSIDARRSIVILPYFFLGRRPVALSCLPRLRKIGDPKRVLGQDGDEQ